MKRGQGHTVAERDEIDHEGKKPKHEKARQMDAIEIRRA